MKIKHKNVAFDVKSVSEEGVIEGYASVYGNIDSYGDVVQKGAFKNLFSKKDSIIPVLWQHDTRQPVGGASLFKEDDLGLYMKASLVMEVQKAQEARALAKAGVVTGLSIGYTVNEYTYNKEEGVTYLTDLNLWEVSLVTFPANTEARVEGVKQILEDGGMPSEREIEELLRQAGFSRTQSKTIISKGYRSLQRDAEDDDAIQMIEGLKANLQELINRRT